MRIGLDVGSTTIKCVVLDDMNNIIYKSYQRHFSKIVESTIELLITLDKDIIKGNKCKLMISGSAGMGMAQANNIPFVQEVYATKRAIGLLDEEIDVAIELGGEDAKILFLKGNMEVRMNGSCAGGTGAFIDQMATLLHCSVDEMNEMSKNANKTYTIASRCGVFAKSDIQPLLNQGATKEDISKSIFYAVVNQTIAGLAQGRLIKGKVLYLGGPLTFISELRNAFDHSLKIKGKLPENSLYFVSMGAANLSKDEGYLQDFVKSLKSYSDTTTFSYILPLFNNNDEYDEFEKRHDNEKVDSADINTYKGNAYLGIDAGSTTIKSVLIDTKGKVLLESYKPNSGNPIPIIKEFLQNLYSNYPNIKIVGSASTGYGEDIIKNAFRLDEGLVETMAHLKAAQAFKPDVDFIIDIGGQDMKCFKIKNNTIDNIFLNEACSSGCGSFLQTFAEALGYDIKDFAKKGILADKPVDLGSRCTVFMNSSVKQAQKDGASIENISAGLSISVVKNAIYKVIRPSSIDALGKNIVVQGGTFYNDAVLRAFENELGINVVRPNIAGLMGAYGAALYVKEKGYTHSNILSLKELENFEHSVSQTNCGLCENHCQLTINRFDNGRKYISGNRCERPITKKIKSRLNMYEYKRNLLMEYKPIKGNRGKIGIPLGLNMYELLPFWHTFFTELGFEVVTSPFSNRDIYLQGQASIPSDTVCFPAKLMHGHIEELIKMNVDTIFYPCMSYNFDENKTDNNYNCPVVAYYPEVIEANMPNIEKVTFIYDYLGLHRKKEFPIKAKQMLDKYFDNINLKDVIKACKKSYEEHDKYLNKVYEKGWEMIEEARKENKPIIVLAGRPYHIDPEISHGIDQLITGFDMAVISEEVIASKVKEKIEVNVLNQWTYHGRLYDAAHYISTQDDMDLVQLVSFGCGVDAITTDECREILEANGKIYTQIKIDEITNLGACKIRLRSLFAANQR
ncbi:MAG: 2-hydroxyglutaryl-CoA dehydratase [Erysipelotrichaceae bacterium]|nr:2-hydroxyglutaryl-CoA dehydratase [Erysipelotrichaceae bacterium]